MTLKDYIYKTNVSSQKAKLKRKETTEQIAAVEGNKKKLQKKYSTLTTDYRDEKYKVTNKKMMNVIKKEIKTNIQDMMQKLQVLGQNLKSLECEGEPSNEQLAYLYSIRRIMEEQVGSKVMEVGSEILNLKSRMQQENMERIEEESLFVSI